MLPVEAAAVSSTRSVGNVPSEEVARIKPQGAPPTCDQRPELAEPASALGHPLERRGDHTEEKAGPGELPGKRGHFPSPTLWLCQDRPCTLRSFPPGVATQRGAGSRGAGREGLSREGCPGGALPARPPPLLTPPPGAAASAPGGSPAPGSGGGVGAGGPQPTVFCFLIPDMLADWTLRGGHSALDSRERRCGDSRSAAAAAGARLLGRRYKKAPADTSHFP